MEDSSPISLSVATQRLKTLADSLAKSATLAYRKEHYPAGRALEYAAVLARRASISVGAVDAMGDFDAHSNP